MKQVLFLIFTIVILAQSCGNSIDKDINKVLNERKTAYMNKDVDLYTSLLSDKYLNKTDDSEENKEAAVKNFKINTTPFDNINITHKDRTAYHEGDKAKVVQKTYVVLDIDNKKNNFETTEIIVLTKEGNNWKITKESKLDLFRGYVFGKDK